MLELPLITSLAIFFAWVVKFHVSINSQQPRHPAGVKPQHKQGSTLYVPAEPAFAGKWEQLSKCKAKLLGKFTLVTSKRASWPPSLEAEANMQFKSDHRQRFICAPSVMWGWDRTVQLCVCEVPSEWVEGQKGVPKILLLWKAIQR